MLMNPYATLFPRLRKAAAFCNFNELRNSADPTEDMIKVALVAGLNKKCYQSKSF